MQQDPRSAEQGSVLKPHNQDPECCDVYGEYCYPCAEGERDPREQLESNDDSD